MNAMTKQTTKTVRSPSGEGSNENGVDETKFEKLWLRQLDFDKVRNSFKKQPKSHI